MKGLLFLINIFFVNPDKINIENILAYNPKKLEIVREVNDFHNKKIKSIKSSKKALYHNVYVQSDKDFYWVIINKEGKEQLYKFYDDLNNLEKVINDEPIDRTISYYYIKENNKSYKITTINGNDAINYLLSYFKKTLKSIEFNGHTLIKLDDELYFVRDSFFINSGKIYSSIEDFNIDLNGKGGLIPELDNKVFNYELNIQVLEKEFKSKLPKNKFSRQDVDNLAELCFDYYKSKDLYGIYLELSSFLLKYMLDNNYGTAKFDQGRLIVTNEKHKYDVGEIVAKSINNLTTFEYNPDLYFGIFPE